MMCVRSLESRANRSSRVYSRHCPIPAARSVEEGSSRPVSSFVFLPAPPSSTPGLELTPTRPATSQRTFLKSGDTKRNIPIQAIGLSLYEELGHSDGTVGLANEVRFSTRENTPGRVEADWVLGAAASRRRSERRSSGPSGWISRPSGTDRSLVDGSSSLYVLIPV